MTGFYFILGASVVVGLVAQLWKQRTGAAWGALTLALGLLFWGFLAGGMSAVEPVSYANPNFRLAIAILTALIVGVLMLLIVATLPRRQRPIAPERGDSMKCPHCAELIKREAKVCRYCGRDVVKAATSAIQT